MLRSRYRHEEAPGSPPLHMTCPDLADPGDEPQIRDNHAMQGRDREQKAAYYWGLAGQLPPQAGPYQTPGSRKALAAEHLHPPSGTSQPASQQGVLGQPLSPCTPSPLETYLGSQDPIQVLSSFYINISQSWGVMIVLPRSLFVQGGDTFGGSRSVALRNVTSSVCVCLSFHLLTEYWV